MSELFGLLAFGADGWGDELAAGAWLTIRLALVTLPFGRLLGLPSRSPKNPATPIFAQSATPTRRCFAVCQSC